MVVSHPRMSLPDGQWWMHGASFSTWIGRSDDTWVAPLPPRRSGGFLAACLQESHVSPFVGVLGVRRTGSSSS